MNILKELIKEALELEIKEIESHSCPRTEQEEDKIANLHFIVDHLAHGEIQINYNHRK